MKEMTLDYNTPLPKLDIVFNDEPLNKMNEEDVAMAKDYCEEDLKKYSSHESCKPIWDENGDLMEYQVMIKYKKMSHDG